MFITFEGIDGSGKTTQATLLSRYLTEIKVNHLLTKEPGTILSKECQQIRKLLLSPENNLSPRAELMLYLADRAQHVDKCIRPALSEDKWVVSDRYSWSTFVYQGCGRQLVESDEFFRDMLGFAAGELWPDLTFIMDCPVEVGLSRAKSSNTEFEGGDRIEREAIDFHKRLKVGFLDVANKYPDKCLVLDATKSIDDLATEVRKVIKGFVI